MDADVFLGAETGSDGLAAGLHQKENLSLYMMCIMFVDQEATCFLHFWGGEKQEKCLTTLMQIKDNTLDFFEKFNVKSELKSL